VKQLAHHNENSKKIHRPSREKLKRNRWEKPVKMQRFPNKNQNRQQWLEKRTQTCHRERDICQFREKTHKK